jgi:hypothetical protein
LITTTFSSPSTVVITDLQMSPSFQISPFKGDEAEANRIYRDTWRPALLSELSRHAFPIHAHGLLGLALTAVEYATYDPNPFVPKVAPPHPGAAGTAAQWSNYKDLKTDYESQEQAEAAAVGVTLANLGDTPRELLRDPVTRRIINNLGRIMITLDAHYGNVTRQELLDCLNCLSERHSSAKDFRAYVTSQRQLHNTFAQAGQPLSEMDKVKYLSLGVEGDPEARICIRMYFTAVPALAAQNFNDLALRIDSMMANRPPPTVNEFMGASVTPNTSTTKLISENESLRAELAEIRQMLRSQQRPKSYCWSHGPCSHSSAGCVQTAAGHVREATMQNKMGGRQGQRKK